MLAIGSRVTRNWKTVFVVCGFSRWKKDAQKRHAALLRLLTSCLGVFDVRRLAPFFSPFAVPPKIDLYFYVVAVQHDDGGEEVGLIIADLLVDFMGDFEDELNSVSSVSIGGVLTTLHRLLHNHASGHNPKLLDIIYTTLQFVVHVRSFLAHRCTLRTTSALLPPASSHTHVQVFKQALFEYGSNSKFCELLSFEILAHCNSTDALIRSKAASMFYLFLRVRPHYHQRFFRAAQLTQPWLPRNPTNRKTGRHRATCRACRCSPRWPSRDLWAA